MELTGIKKNSSIRLATVSTDYNQVISCKISKDGSTFVSTTNNPTFLNPALVSESISVKSVFDTQFGIVMVAQDVAAAGPYTNFSGMITAYADANTALNLIKTVLTGTITDYSTVISACDTAISANSAASASASANDSTPTTYLAADTARYAVNNTFNTIYNRQANLFNTRYIDLTASEMNADLVILVYLDPDGNMAQQDNIYTISSVPGSGATAQEVWEYATRTLTSGGGGISAADVWGFDNRTLTGRVSIDLTEHVPDITDVAPSNPTLGEVLSFMWIMMRKGNGRNKWNFQKLQKEFDF